MDPKEISMAEEPTAAIPTKVFFKFPGKQWSQAVRLTPDNKYVSATDLVAQVIRSRDQTIVRQTWLLALINVGTVVEEFYMDRKSTEWYTIWRFPGYKCPSSVINVVAAYYLVCAMRGPLAEAYVESGWLRKLVHVMGGDDELIEEMAKRQVVRLPTLPPPPPLRLLPRIMSK
jgi:hypothetical protein